MSTAEVNSKNTPKQTNEIILVNKHSENPGETPLNLILHSNLLNFIIVIAFLVWVIKKANVASLIANKRKEIAESIKNAEDEKKIKENHLAITQNKISNVNQEIVKIVDEGEHIANNLSKSILEDANKQAEDMHKKAIASIGAEKQLVSNEVMEKITGAAFYIAEEHIKQAIDERLHRKYIDEFIDNLDTIQS